MILDLICRPGVMMEHVREDVEREKRRLKNAERERAAWVEELGKIERRRDALIEMRADGDITKEEFRQKVTGLDARRAAAERELKTLAANTGRLETLDSLPGLVEEYIRELPYLVQGPQRITRDHVVKEEFRKDGPGPYLLTPEMFRERTPEEKEGLRRTDERKRSRRCRAMYELLGLKIVAQKDGTLEVSGTFGVTNMELGSEPTSAWKSVTRENDEELPPPDGYLANGEDRCHDLRAPRLTLFPRQGLTKRVERLTRE